MAMQKKTITVAITISVFLISLAAEMQVFKVAEAFYAAGDNTYYVSV